MRRRVMEKSDAVKGPVLVMNVKSVEESLARITEKGGRVIVPKMDVGGMGQMLILRIRKGMYWVFGRIGRRAKIS